MLKDLRTSTKLFLLCGMFVAAIVLATYSLIREKQIAIEIVRKELVGAQYLEALRGVYAVILEPASQASQRQASAIAAMDALTKAEARTGGSLHTATLAENLATKVRDLIASGTGDDSGPLTGKALAGARDLAARIGDESNLALDPDLDSYYIQNIVVKRVPALLSQMGELQSLLTRSPSGDDSQVRPFLLDGMIRSSIEDIDRDAEAASRRDADGQLKRTVAPPISSMVSAVNTYLGTANMVLSGQGNPTSLPPAFEAAYQRIDNAWAVEQVRTIWTAKQPARQPAWQASRQSASQRLGRGSQPIVRRHNLSADRPAAPAIRGARGECPRDQGLQPAHQSGRGATKSASSRPPSMPCWQSLPQHASGKRRIRRATRRCKPNSPGLPV